MIPEVKRHTLIGNKLLMLFSGLSRNTKKNGKPFYEKHHVGLANEYVEIGKWSTTMVKQMMAYVSMCDSNGMIPYISEKELANLMDCSVRTIQMNNKKFIKYGIITCDRAFMGHISISLCNYVQNVLDLHKGERDGGIVRPKEDSVDDVYAYLGEEEGSFYSKSGYTSISHELLYRLFKIKDVNVIRLICRVLYRYEIDVNLHMNDSTLISLDDLKQVLPRYVGHKKAIKKLMREVKDILNIEIYDTEEKLQEFLHTFKPSKSNLEKIKDSFVSAVTLPKIFDSKKNKEKEYASATVEFSTFTRKWQSLVNPGQQELLSKKDLYSYTVTFGLDVMKRAFSFISSMISNYHLHAQAIHSLEEDFSRKFYAIAQNYAFKKQDNEIASIA